MEDFNINSKIIIFCLIICLLIPLGAVSASDVNSTADDQVLSATPSVDTLSASVNPEQDNDTLSVQENENLLSAGSNSGNDNLLGADGDVGSYSDLNELIKLTDSGSTLPLLKNYEYKDSSESAGIVISKPITIEGNGFTINGNNLGPGFIVHADNVTLKNINIINCVSPTYTVSYAGAVYWRGDNGKLINTNITNCKITTGTYATSGGISWWGKDGEITQVNVSQCSSPSGDRRGAMLSCAGIDLKISQSVFHDVGSLTASNIAGIAVLGSSANVAFNNCNFTNIATNNYGQFFYEATSGLTFKGCIFNETQNKAIIFSRGSDVTYDDCEFYCNNHLFAYQALHYATFNHCTFDSFSQIHDAKSPVTDVICGMRDNLYNGCTFVNCGDVYKPYVGSVDSYVGCTFVNCTNAFIVGPTSGYMVVSGCIFDNTTSNNDAVIAVSGGQKNIIENNVFKNIPDTITRDIYVTSNAGAYINNDGARIVNDGNSISKIDELYVTETGTGKGTGWSDACNITYALINIMKDGHVHIKKGTYDLMGQEYNVNFIMDNEKDVCFTNGTLTVKNGYSIHDLIFTNLTKAVEIGFHSNISNSTFKDFSCMKFDSDYRTPVYLSYTSNLDNCIFKNITADWIIGHFIHGVNSISVDTVNVTNCTLNTGFIYYAVGSNSKFRNININNTTLGSLVKSDGSGVYQDVNDIRFDTIYISNSTFTVHVYSSNKAYARSVSFNHLTIENTNHTGYAHLFNGMVNTVFDDVNLININLTARKDVYVFGSAYTGSNSLKNINIVNFTNTLPIIHETNTVSCMFSDVNLYNVTTSSFIDTAVSDRTLSGLNFNKTNFTSDVIFTFNDNVVLKDSNFTDYTGHIVVEGSSLTFTNNRFINGNNSLLNGSAIWLDGNYVIFDNCIFTGNNASYGTVYITNSSLKPTFTNCNFKTNNATGLNTGNVTGLGGAIYINTIEGQEFALSLDSNTNATLDNKNNYYNNLFMKGAMKKLYSTVYVVLDPDNWHPETGSSDGNARENATSFTNAWTGVGPGTVFIFVNSSEVYDFTNAPVNVFTGIDRNIVFIGNDTTLNGARFTVSAPATNMKVYNFTYTNVTSGPVIIWNSTGGYMENCNFIDNGGENIAYGGAIEVLKNNLTLNKTSFINNTAGNSDAGYGGALYINASNVKIEKCIFDSNNAYNTGSHIYVDSDLEEIRITDSEFDNGNKYLRPIQGSGVVVQGSNIKVLRNNFTNNTGRVGSGLYVMGDIANSNINNNKFENNTAKSLAEDGYAAALYTKFTNKKTSTNNINGNTFINNTAQLNGGAWYIDSMDTVGLILDNNVFNGNNATNGGAVYINNPDLTLTAKYAENNAVNGGAVYINSNNVVLSDSLFEGNNATNGGAVYIMGDNAVLTTNNFTSNYANDGGALFVDADDVRVSDSEFKDNSALNHGSAIYVADDKVITLTNTKLTGNSAGKDIVSDKKYDDISYAGTLPSINGKFLIDDLSEGALYYINRTEITAYIEVYITNGGSGTGGINDPTNWENAITKILKDGIIYIVTDNFKVNNEMIELLEDANLTNVTIVGINKTKITRNDENDKYLFNQPKKC